MQDAFVGYWIDDKPYIFVEDEDYKKCRRNYVNLDKKYAKLECGWASRYFGNTNDEDTQLKINGRNYYQLFDNTRYREGGEVRRPKSRSLTKYINLIPFNNQTFSLSNLICHSLASDEPYVEILKSLRHDCTIIGKKMATSLIKVAATRIFAEPEQSIMELPVNSVDSYNPSARVGKFGMGFFSILYWLIGHPKRYVKIESFIDKCAWRVIIREDEKLGLVFTPIFVDSQVTISGTYIEINAHDDHFDATNVTNFRKQINKLRLISSASIILNDLELGEVNTKPVFVKLDDTQIIVEDRAGGISPDVLFGSLFIPSISTKTIKSKITGKTSASYISLHDRGFNIMVSEVIVVTLQISTSIAVYISMPPQTRLPVSRDDIILDADTLKIFIEQLQSVVEMVIEHKGLTRFQNMLDDYKNYTASDVNRTAIEQVEQYIIEKYKRWLIPINNLMLTAFSEKFVASNVVDYLELEITLDEITQPDLTVWYGKKVLFVKNLGDYANSFGFYTYFFVDKDYVKKNPEWKQNITLAYTRTKLIRIGDKAAPADEVIDVYRSDLKKAIKHAKNKLSDDHEAFEMYVNLRLRLESLKVFFTFTPDNEMRLTNWCVMVYQDFGKKFFLDISIALLGKFSQFKGNSTYGGAKYTLFIQDYMDYARPRPLKITRLVEFQKKSMFISIDSCNEGNQTNIILTSLKSPFGIYNYLNESFDPSELIRAPSLFKFTIAGCFFPLSVVGQRMSTKNTFKGYFDYMYSIIIESKEILEGIYRNLTNNINQASMVPEVKYEQIASTWMHIVNNREDEPEGFDLEDEDEDRLVARFPCTKEIAYLYNHDPDFDDLTTTFIDIANSRYQPLKLQVIEIAINEGTTKPPMEASMVELIQNSVDAIRESKTKQNTITTYLAISNKGKHLKWSIVDHVGLNSVAFVYIGIPFLSTKTPSPLVTGEMGSGFFNVYRETESVVITSGDFVIVDRPLRETGDRRVYDIDRSVYLAKKPSPSYTRIDLIIPYKNHDDLVSKVSLIRFYSGDVLGSIQIPLYLNDNYMNNNRIIVYEYKGFEISFCTRNQYFTSYILTNSIPFVPLSTYFKQYISPTIEYIIAHNIYINIKSGSYLPVQSRSRVKLDDDSNFDNHLISMTVFIACLYLYVYDINYRHFIDHTNSTVNADHLRMSATLFNDDYIASTIKYSGYVYVILQNYVFDAKEKTNIAILINKRITLLKGRPLSKLSNAQKTEFIYKNANLHSGLVSLINKALDIWFKSKNTADAYVKSATSTKVKTKKSTIDVEVVTGKDYDVLARWIKRYIKIAKKIGIKGYDRPSPSIEFIRSKYYNSMGFSGFYDITTNKISILVNSWKKNDLEELAKTLMTAKQTKIYKALEKNTLWDTYFALTYPASTIPHELEHFRRNDAHVEGVHGNITGPLIEGDLGPQRTFTESTNFVYERVIAGGLYRTTH